MASTLGGFLSESRSEVLTNSPEAADLTLVLGNPSCDLDSFISAVTLAYFYTRAAALDNKRSLVAPLLNLPTTPSRALWKIRPEFGTALRLAIDEEEDSTVDRSQASDPLDREKNLLEQLTTIADIRAEAQSPLHSLFLGRETTPQAVAKTKVTLVDHNAVSVPELSADVFASQIEITGCVDHHDDESYVPSGVSPRIIKTGIGSCTSLVVQHLRDKKFWTPTMEGSSQKAMTELARLALVPILIDTANLTDKSKVSDTDRDAVQFLESFIPSHTGYAAATTEAWDRNSFYKEISTSKANSLNMLSLPEIFERDYKEWTESTTDGREVNIGISSVVKPISWLALRAGRPADFANQVGHFMGSPDQNLDLFAIMTTSTSSEGQFQRELMIVASGKAAVAALKNFESKASEQLQLSDWEEVHNLAQIIPEKLRQADSAVRVWWQCEVSKSRKQVAPLVRNTVRNT